MTRTILATVSVLAAFAIVAPPPAAAETAKAADAANGAPDADLREIRGLVAHTTSVSGYTYVQVETDEGLLWAAGPRAEVKVGDRVRLSHAALMEGFYSSSLGRRFDQIYFAASLRVEDAGTSGPASAPHCTPAPASTAPLERARGGHRVAELVDRRSELAGERVRMRGRVVKVNSSVLGRNWIHVEDGSQGSNGVTSLTVTSLHAADVGCIVVLDGTLVIDADFGYGYRYPLLIEDATLEFE